MGLLTELRSHWTGPFSSKSSELARLFGVQPTSTGLPVNEYTALNFSAVYAADAIISGDVASLPLPLYKLRKDGGKERFVDSKLYELMHDAPNPEMTSMVFRETLQSHVNLWGNGYAEIERDQVTRPIALWPITPDRVTPFRDGRNLMYRVVNPGRPDVFLEPMQMLHIPGLGFNGIEGYSVVSLARESIGLGLATERFGGTFFGSGSSFGGVLSFKRQRMDKEFKQGVRESIDAMHTGVDRAHRFLLLGDEAKYERLGIPPNDAQFLETRRFQVTEIARWFLIPPHKLGDLERATFSNIEQQDIEYYKSGLRRWLVRWEQELNRKLISPLERKLQKFEHNVEGLLRGDSQARAEFNSKMFNIGAYSINMILEKENMNPIGPEGDVHFVPVNMTPARLAMEGPPKPAPAPEPKPAVDPAPQRDEIIEGEFRVVLAEITENTQAIQKSLLAAQDARTEEERARCAAELEALRTEATRLQLALTDARAESDGRAAQVTAAEDRTRAIEAEAATLAAQGVTAVEARDAALSAVATREAELAEARVTLMAAVRERERFDAELAARENVSAEKAVEYERKLHELAERTEQLSALHAAVADREADLAAVRVDLQAADARLMAETDARTAAETAAQQMREAELQRMTAVIAAHRGLLVDAMGRMVRRETEKARRQQATPEKLRHWIDVFYVTHEDTCVEALLPAVRVHLAWAQSADDPLTVTRQIVREHIADSTRQLRAVANGDPDDLHVSLERMLLRWEEDRAAALADRILHEEIEHARTL
jgi:HK97 family phage portal protein